MRVLLTRPRRESAALAGELAGHGIGTLTAPMLTIRHEAEAPLAAAGIQALLVTSANAAAAFAAAGPVPDIPALAVGDATAAALRRAGFARVISADGDAAALRALARARLDPAAGRLLHGRGETVAADLAAWLRADGFAVDERILYRAEPVPVLPSAARDALLAGGLDGVLLFSPRTAAIFADRVRAAGLGGEAGGLTAWCLSRRVAAAAAPLPWRRIRVAARPRGCDLLALLLGDANS